LPRLTGRAPCRRRGRGRRDIPTSRRRDRDAARAIPHGPQPGDRADRTADERRNRCVPDEMWPS